MADGSPSGPVVLEAWKQGISYCTAYRPLKGPGSCGIATLVGRFLIRALGSMCETLDISGQRWFTVRPQRRRSRRGSVVFHLVEKHRIARSYSQESDARIGPRRIVRHTRRASNLRLIDDYTNLTMALDKRRAGIGM